MNHLPIRSESVHLPIHSEPVPRGVGAALSGKNRVAAASYDTARSSRSGGMVRPSQAGWLCDRLPEPARSICNGVV